jgi:type IV pilus assembly protein PilV
MVALLVISIGLLGIAALQMSSLKISSSAYWHNQAVWYSYEITDRINANRSAFAEYAGLDTDGDYDADCQSGACSPSNMVTADAQDWKNLVSKLPDGRGFISAPNANSLTISVMWDDGAKTTNCTNGESDPGTRTCYTWTVTR